MWLTVGFILNVVFSIVIGLDLVNFKYISNSSTRALLLILLAINIYFYYLILR